MEATYCNRWLSDLLVLAPNRTTKRNRLIVPVGLLCPHSLLMSKEFYDDIPFAEKILENSGGKPHGLLTVG